MKPVLLVGISKIGIGLVTLAGVVSITSSAQGSIADCKSIADPMSRLACYDKATVTPSSKTPVASHYQAAPVNAMPIKARELSPVRSGPRSWFEAEIGAYGFYRNLGTQAATTPPTVGPIAVPTAPGFAGLFSTSTATNPIPAETASASFGGGGSYRMGRWLDPQRTTAIDGSVFLAMGYGKRSPGLAAGSTNTFINTTPDVFVGLFNDTTTTTINGGAWDLLYGADVNYRATVPHFAKLANLSNFDVMLGMRYVGLDEFTASSTTIFARTYQPALGLPQPTNLANYSSTGWSRVYNNFIGPQFGFSAEQHWGPYWVMSENKVAVGATVETLTTGQSIFSVTPATGIFLAGIPLMVNSGGPPITGVTGGSVRSRAAFTVVPNGSLKLGYDIIPNQRSLTLGYNYLYMSEVGLLAVQSPSSVGTRQSGFFSQGVALGVKEQF